LLGGKVGREFGDKNPKTIFFPFLFLILQKETKNPWLSLSSWEDSNNKFHGKDKKMFVSLQGVCCALAPAPRGTGTIAFDPTFGSLTLF